MLLNGRLPIAIVFAIATGTGYSVHSAERVPAPQVNAPPQVQKAPPQHALHFNPTEPTSNDAAHRDVSVTSSNPLTTLPAGYPPVPNSFLRPAPSIVPGRPRATNDSSAGPRAPSSSPGTTLPSIYPAIRLRLLPDTKVQTGSSSDADRTYLAQADATKDQEVLVEPQRTSPFEAQAEPIQPAVEAAPLPWWQNFVAKPMRPETTPLEIDLQSIIVRALNHSNQIKVFSKLPLIRETTVGEATAAFDWSTYLSSRWDDVSDPVGSSLTVGGDGNRFNDHNLSGSAGLRRQTHSGAKVDIAQRFGWQDNNSNFFTPAPQGSSRLTLRLTQPILRGGGAVYNNSLIVLAQIDRRQADDEFQRQLQSHLLEVTRSYWGLYLERGVLLQKLQLYQRASEITRQLELRAQLDASASQLISAQATRAQRRSDLFRAQAAVVNAESKIRALVNDPALSNSDQCELIPIEPPSIEPYAVDLRHQRSLAVQHRPEVGQAIKQIRSASVRLNMSKHELLPVLNLVTEAYVSGLQGEGDVAAAVSRQFDTGSASYGVGLEYELPIGNRAARFRNQRRLLELSQLNYQYKATLSNVDLEVEVAVRELQTSQRELSAKYESQHARTRQLHALTQRWQRNINDAVTGSFALENLLDAQDRVAQAEFEYLQSQLTFNLSISNLHRATGTLLVSEPIAEYQKSDFEPSAETQQQSEKGGEIRPVVR